MAITFLELDFPRGLRGTDIPSQQRMIAASILRRRPARWLDPVVIEVLTSLGLGSGLRAFRR